MKRQALVLAVLAVVFLLAGSEPVRAEAVVKDAVIAVVDMRAILREAEAAKDIQQQLESKKSSYQKEISAEEQRLRTKEQDLRKLLASAKGEDASMTQKKQEFEKEVIEAQKMVQEHKRDLDAALDKSLDKLKDETSAVVADVAKEKGVNVVLSREAVILAEKTLDITPEVIERLNKKIKKIPLATTGKKK